MVIVISAYEVIPGQEAHFEKMWKEASALQSEQRGLLSSRLLRSLQSPSRYTVYTVWDSETDVAAAALNPGLQQLVKRYPLIAPPQQQRFVMRYSVAPGGEIREDDRA